jgi:hypothetical protein
MSAISRKIGALGAAIGLLATGFQGCSANEELTGGSEEDVATAQEAVTSSIYHCAKYEAESMTKIGLTGNTTGGITLFSNSSALEQVHSFDPGPQLHGIAVYARGTFSGGAWPQMRLRVDGVIQGPIDPVTVDSSTYQQYLFFYTAPGTIGNHTMRIEFTNDNGGARDLHIDGLAMSCPIGVRCGTGWCDTNGTGNVCCINSNGTSPVCQSAASCNSPKHEISCDNHQECPLPAPPASPKLCKKTSSAVSCQDAASCGLGCVCLSPGMSQQKTCAAGTCLPTTYGGSWRTCQ